MNWAWLSAGESEKGAQRTRNAADGASVHAREGGSEIDKMNRCVSACKRCMWTRGSEKGRERTNGCE